MNRGAQHAGQRDGSLQPRARGTMFVLMLHGIETGVLPGRRVQFAGAVHGVEMAVKDKTRTREGWAYYDFGGMDGGQKAARLLSGRGRRADYA